MGLRNTPDIEQIGDVDRFLIRAYVPHRGSVVRVEGTDRVDTVVLSDAKKARRLMTFADFIEQIKVGIPPATYIVLHGMLQYVRPNTRNQRSQGLVIEEMSIEGFPTTVEYDGVDVAHKVYYPEYVTFTDALRILERGDQIGVALSPNIGLITQEKGPIRVTYQHDIIGSIEGGKPVLLKKFNHLDMVVKSICNLI